MRIAVDARVMSDGAGKAVYTKSVVEAWRKEGANHEFTLYGFRPADANEWPSNWRFVELDSRWSRLIAFRKLTEDVLFSPSSYLTTLLSNIPTLMTVHDLVAYVVPVKLPLKTIIAEKLLLRFALAKAAIVTVQTKSVETDVNQFFPRFARKVRVVKPGVSASVSKTVLPVASRQQMLLTEKQIDRHYILFVGTIEPRKNITRLIEAYTKLPVELKENYQLVIAGRVGWLDAKLRLALSNLPSGVVKTGRVSDEALATLYNNCKVIVYPSLYEGVGYPVLEGYYWGKPVITSNNSSLAEIGTAAILVDALSEEEISNAITSLLTNQSEIAGLVNKGYEALGQYSWQKTATEYMKLMEEIVK